MVCFLLFIVATYIKRICFTFNSLLHQHLLKGFMFCSLLFTLLTFTERMFCFQQFTLATFTERIYVLLLLFIVATCIERIYVLLSAVFCSNIYRKDLWFAFNSLREQPKSKEFMFCFQQFTLATCQKIYVLLSTVYFSNISQKDYPFDFHLFKLWVPIQFVS